MTIEINLNEEQTDALNTVVSAANATIGDGGTPWTPQTYLEDRLFSAIHSYVNQAYNASVASLGEAAAQMSYEDRKALISQIKESIIK